MREEEEEEGLVIWKLDEEDADFYGKLCYGVDI